MSKKIVIWPLALIFLVAFSLYVVPRTRAQSRRFSSPRGPSPADCDAHARHSARHSSGSILGGAARGAVRGHVFGAIVGGKKARRRGRRLGAVVGGARRAARRREVERRVYDDCMAGRSRY